MTTTASLHEANRSVTHGTRTGQYLTFILAGEEYGVDILRVQEIKGWDRVTPIPHTPAHILGVINLRGTIVPIMDLRLRFGIGTADYGTTTVVMVLKVVSEERERTMGFVVDAVSDVHDVGPEEMKPAPEFGSSVDTRFVRALAAVEQKMIILLDIDALVGSDLESLPSELQ
jgi:purine-binding chemotaxis protein CheW